jgi:hypothetical protein
MLWETFGGLFLGCRVAGFARGFGLGFGLFFGAFGGTGRFAVALLLFCFSCFSFVLFFVFFFGFVLFCLGSRRRVAVGGVGDGETGTVSLYNVGNLNKLDVLFLAPPHQKHDEQHQNASQITKAFLRRLFFIF